MCTFHWCRLTASRRTMRCLCGPHAPPPGYFSGTAERGGRSWPLSGARIAETWTGTRLPSCVLPSVALIAGAFPASFAATIRTMTRRRQSTSIPGHLRTCCRFSSYGLLVRLVVRHRDGVHPPALSSGWHINLNGIDPPPLRHPPSVAPRQPPRFQACEPFRGTPSSSRRIPRRASICGPPRAPPPQSTARLLPIPTS